MSRALSQPSARIRRVTAGPLLSNRRSLPGLQGGNRTDADARARRFGCAVLGVVFLVGACEAIVYPAHDVSTPHESADAGLSKGDGAGSDGSGSGGIVRPNGAIGIVGSGSHGMGDLGVNGSGTGGSSPGVAETGDRGTGGGPVGDQGGGGPNCSDSAADVSSKRQEVIEFLWGSEGFPSDKLPSSVDKNVHSPVAGLSNLERVDTLHIRMDEGFESLAHHFIPSHSKQHRLVILHHGHASSFDDNPSLKDAGYGMQRTINNLLGEGYSVLAVYMPGCLPGQPAIPHSDIVETVTNGSGMKFFLEPVAVCLNYLQSQSDVDHFPAYGDFSMVGLSGGGWTTTVYAAVDPRITLSIPVAGSLPLSLRSGYSWGDEEQWDASFYQIADYVDLYVLGSSGTGRRQVQVLNRYDDCCFGESSNEYDAVQTGMSYDDAVRAYERDVRKRLKDLRSGSFRLEIDEAAPGHMISWNTIATTILAELDGGDGTVAQASTGDTFVRGTGGTLVHVGVDRAVDTGIPMVGVPASVRRGADSYDVLFRDPKSRLMHAFNTGSTWTAESWDAIIITDPVVAVSSPSRFDVVALTPDYLPHHWRSNASGLLSEAVAGTSRIFGPPVLSSLEDNQLDVFAQGWDHAQLHLCDDGAGVWAVDPPTEPPVSATP